ncbi:MAG TPA: hypothetical protein VFE47_24620 [Tepidisphaeraceae bacterium]|jgi:hypothetical protein|nr:hypothetical protein [Tepidisphaeraceae bacterium]
MPTDRLVTAAHVLKAVMEYERRGSTKVLSDLEKLEPDLVEYLLENLTRLYHNLAGFGLSAGDTRKAYRLAEKTAVVCLMALRKAHHDLWQADPSSPDDPPPSP